MSSKNNLKSHPYKQHRRDSIKSQHLTGQQKRSIQHQQVLSLNNTCSSSSSSSIHLQHSKVKSDPGLPNIQSIKRRLDVKLQRQALINSKRLHREQHHSNNHNNIVSNNKNSIDLLNDDNDIVKQQSNDLLKRRWYYKELKEIIERSDILIEVLDARDPLGSRCYEVERLIASNHSNKRIILLLNKIDLVPLDIVQKWTKYLRREYPCIPFKSSTHHHTAQHYSKHQVSSINSIDDKIVKHGSSIGASALLQLLKNYSRSADMKKHITVGLFGYPNVGKSSIINSMKRTRAVAVSSIAGFTKSLQEVKLDSQLSLIDSPGVLFSHSSSGNDKNDTDDQHDPQEALLLRNVLRIDQLDDLITPVQAILKRCEMHSLQEIYSINSYNDVDEFLIQVAQKRGKLSKGGIPDLQQAARTVLQDWNEGRIPFYTQPPASNDVEESEIVTSFSKEFDLNQFIASVEGTDTDAAMADD